jgi:predicted Zn-dependent protease
LLPDPKDKVEEQNLLHIAMMASEDGQTCKARAALQKLLGLDNASEVALVELGRVEMESKNYARAADYLREAQKARPDDATVALDYGRALELNGDLAGARNALQTSIKVNPQLFDARLLLGQVDLKLNNPKASEDEFEAALLLQPASTEAQIGLASGLLSEKKFADAAELLEESVKSSPRSAELFELLAQAYGALGKHVQAQRAEAQAKKLRIKKDSH